MFAQQRQQRLIALATVLVVLAAITFVRFAPPARADTQTLNSVADAPVKENAASTNFGSDLLLRTQNTVGSNKTEYRSYLKFDLTGVTGTLTSATLRLYTTDSSSSGYDTWSVANTSWVETGAGSITWANKPALGTNLGASGAITANTWTSRVVTSAITLGQLNSLAITGRSSSDLHFYSKEQATNKPELILNFTPPATTTTTTPPQSPPTVTTGAASNLAQATATLNGTVNPNGAATTCHFEYGTTTGYGTNTPDDTSPGSGTSAVPVSANVSSLTADTLYHFRLSCTNSAGTTNGSDATFTTLATPPPSCLHSNDYGTIALAVTATPVDGCLIVDQDYTLTSQLTINKSMQLLCQSPGTGFNAANSSGLRMLRVATTDEVIVDGCEIYGTGALTNTTSAVTVSGVVGCATPVAGCMFGVKFQHLDIHDIGFGYLTDSGSAQRWIHFTDNTCTTLGGSCAGFFGANEADVFIQRNTSTATQLTNHTGNAAFQTGGTSSNAHTRFTVQGNRVFNPGPCTFTRVGYGFDQLSSSLVGGATVTPGTGDGNLYEHCLPGGAPGEGIVVNGPNNQIKGNKVLGVGNGSITLITYGNPNQANINNILDNNDTDGLGQSGGQGVALSFPSAALGGATPVTGLRLTNSRHVGQPFGLQAYGYGGGTVVPGSDNEAHDNDFGNGCAWSVVAHIATGNTPASCNTPPAPGPFKDGVLVAIGSGEGDVPCTGPGVGHWRVIVIHWHRFNDACGLAQIRAANPGVSIYAYSNFGAMLAGPHNENRPTSCVTQEQADTQEPNHADSWYLHRADNGQHYVYDDYAYLKASDVASPTWQQACIAILDQMKLDGVDGVLFDDTNFGPPNHGLATSTAVVEFPSIDAYAQAVVDSFTAIAAAARAKGLLVGANVGLNPWEPGPRAKALAVADDMHLFHREFLTRWNGTGSNFPCQDLEPNLTLFKAVNDLGAGVSAETKYGPGPQGATADAQYGVAAWWLVRTGARADAWAHGPGDHYTTAWGPDLGTPETADRVQVASCVWKRPYTGGIAVVNATAGAVTVDLGGTYVRPDGQQVQSVTLAATSGMVLTKP
jgi:hypothetical protein